MLSVKGGIAMRKETVMKLMKLTALAVWAAVIVLLLTHWRSFSAASIASFAPKNPYAAAGVLWLLFACKTLSLMFPIKLLEMASGLLYAPIWAFLINLIGCAVCISIGYLLGRYLGQAAAKKAASKSKRLTALLERQRSNIIFFSFLLRCMSFLPMDAVSLYFGASRVTYWKYLLGSLLGLLPNIMISTLMGSGLSDPTSPLFLCATGAFLLIGVVSLLLYARMTKPKKQ